MQFRRPGDRYISIYAWKVWGPQYIWVYAWKVWEPVHLPVTLEICNAGMLGLCLKGLGTCTSRNLRMYTTF